MCTKFTGGSCARSSRLQQAYSDPMAEIYLLFYQSALQLFINCNKFLQREDPLIPIMLEQMEGFLKKLFGKFIKVNIIKDAKDDVITIDYNRGNQLPGTT